MFLIPMRQLVLVYGAFILFSAKLNAVDTSNIISKLKHDFPGKSITQIQYTVDLKSGVLWVYKLDLNLDNNDYIIKYSYLPKDNIIDIQNKKLIYPSDVMSGIAMKNNELYNYNQFQKNWEKTTDKSVNEQIEVFNYFYLNSCEEYLSDLKDAKSIANLKTEKSDITAEKILLRDSLNFRINNLSNGFITDWSVLQDGVLLRYIVNIISDSTEIVVPKINESNANITNYNIKEKLGKNPAIGMLFLLKNDGKYHIEVIAKDSPAEKAGLRIGDVILKVNGKKLEGKSVEKALGFIQENLEPSFEIEKSSGEIVTQKIKRVILN